MADTFYSLDEMNAPQAAKPKPVGKVIPLTSIGEVAKPKQDEPSAFSKFLDRSTATVKAAGATIYDDPSAAIEGAFNAGIKGIASLTQMAVSGVGALAKAATGGNVDQIVQTKEAIEKRINLVNQAPADRQEEAMQNLLGIIPDGVTAVGDTVFDKTGSALAGAGAQALTTLLTLNPEIAGKVMKGAGEWTKGKPETKLGGAFDTLVATDSEAAQKVADHINQVDPVTAKVLHKRIQKYIDASEDELNLIGRNAADAAIEEISGDYDKVRAQANLPGYLGSGAERGMGSGESGTSKRSRVRAGGSGMLDAPGDVGLSVGEGKGPKTRRMAADSGRPTFGHFDNIDEGMFERYAELDSKNAVVKSKDLLQEMFEHTKKALGSQTGQLQLQLLSQLNRLVPNISIHFTDDLIDSQGERFDNAAGIYDGHTNKIKVSLAKGADTHAILHELTHAATTRFIHFNPDHPLVVKLEKLRQAAESVLKKSGETYNVRSHYGIENVHEFVAEAMTNRDFQRFLGRIKTLNKETLMSRFVDTVKSILGYKPGDNVRFLERVIRTSEDLMETAGKARREGKTIPGREPATAPIKVTPEQASSTIRETVKQALGAIDEAAKDSTKAGEDNVLYFNNGIPVTRQAIEGAFRAVGEGLRMLPGAKIAEAKLGSLFEGYIKMFNPEAMGPAAREAGAAIAQNWFKRTMDQHAVWEDGKARREYWIKMGQKAQLEFIHGFETGKKFDNPIFEAARIRYKQQADRIHKQDIRTWATAGKDAPYEPVEHYLPRQFVDNAAVERWMRRPEVIKKWGDPRFIKERSFELYADALKQGFTLKSTNPEEMMMGRQLASDTAMWRNNLLMDLEKRGLAIKARPGEGDRGPPGTYSQSYKSPTGQRYWVNEEVGPLMANVYDQRSMWEDPRLRGQGYRFWMEQKNKLVQTKLFASFFHPLHVMHIDASAELTGAAKELIAGEGNVVGRAANFIGKLVTTAPYTPGSIYKTIWANRRTGYPLLKVFQGLEKFENLSEADQEAFKTLAESGLIPTRPQEEMSGAIQKARDAVAARSATALWHLPWALMSGISHPIFSLWIPSLKIASLLRDAATIDKLNPELSARERQIMLRDAARKVEARYGEMNRNSQFINKTFQDAMIATNLSWGWNAGLLDQYVGGAIDAGRVLTDRGSLKDKAKSGRLDRPIMATVYVGSALVLGGLITKFMGGKDPDSIEDYTHPLSGDTDKYGKPVRLNTMWYTREFEALYKHMAQEGQLKGIGDFILSKGSGLMEMAKSAWTGLDSLGNEFRNPNAPIHKQIEQSLLYEFGELNPISIEAINKNTNKPDDIMHRIKNVALPIAGFTPAGKYISQTVTEGKIDNAYNRYIRPAEKPYMAVQRSKDFPHLAQLYEKGGPAYDQALDAAIEKYQLTPKDVGRLEKSFRHEANYDPSIQAFKELSRHWEVQKELLDQMTPAEREKYLPVSNKEHLRNHYEAP